MTREEFEEIKKKLLGVIDQDQKESLETLELITRHIEDLRLAREVTLKTLEAIKHYVNG